MDLYPYNFAIVQLLNKIRFNNYHIPGGSVGKESTCNAGEPGLILGRIHLQYRWPRVQSLGGEDPLEKEITSHTSNLAWEIPWTEEPGGLQSMGSQRFRHDLVTETNIWKWQPTPVLLPGKSHGLRSLIGYSPWGHKELDTTERLEWYWNIMIFMNSFFIIKYIVNKKWQINIALKMHMKHTWKLPYFVLYFLCFSQCYRF